MTDTQINTYSKTRPTIVLVGGFLGSGKTTLILAAARLLAQRGLRSAVILNDQSDGLVDTRLTQAQGILAGEVTGGCFCCRLSDLLTVIEQLRPQQLDVIFAEPVGSCTDLSATVIAPLLEDFDKYRVAPFTVVIDPARAATLLGDNAADGPDSDMAFLFQNQLQEADIVCLNKSDIHPNPGCPWSLAFGDQGKHEFNPQPRSISALTGFGVSEWLDEILFGTIDPGAITLDIDYARYARAEAALAWLNLRFTFEPSQPLSPALVIGPFLDALDQALTAANIPIVHLKIFDSAESGWLKAAECANGDQPRLEGHLDASPAARHELLLNLRAQADPDPVRDLVQQQLHQLSGTISHLRFDCFSPAAPSPQRRLTRP
jgi:Ni2+-binding GTPase involved in maturation of urease and hydrogenase